MATDRTTGGEISRDCLTFDLTQIAVALTGVLSIGGSVVVAVALLCGWGL